MTGLSSLCVYCGSSVGHRDVYAACARELGAAMAQARIRLVYGGGRVGLMGVIADSVLAHGGQVTGVIPTFLRTEELAHPDIDETIEVGSMHARKHRMFELADGFVVLPGGTGTLDEAIEVLTWKQLHLHDKPIILVSPNGYWAPLVDLLGHIIGTGFAPHRVSHLFELVDRPRQAIDVARRAGAARAPARGDRL